MLEREPAMEQPSGSRKRSRGHRWSRQPNKKLRRLSAELISFSSPRRETLTYAEAQKLVDVEMDGVVRRINICDPLEMVSKDDKFYSELIHLDSGVPDKPATNSGQSSPQKPLFQPSFKLIDSHQVKNSPKRPTAYFRAIEKTQEELDEEVEYDMDEEDHAWLKIINDIRKKEKQVQLSFDDFEFAMDRLEKEAFVLSLTNDKTETTTAISDEDAFCAVCRDDECQNTNVILFCDLCNLAVHQDCYGVAYIPEGQWLCRKCQKSPYQAVECCLCPVKGGALKQTDDGRWAHVVCALWIPEVGFGNVTALEPIDRIARIPPARRKLMCSICKMRGVGACVQCSKTNCYTAFHVTCASQAGLYMKIEPVRENGRTVNVKKTAFCEHHNPPNLSPFQPIIDNSIDSDDDGRPSRPRTPRKVMKRRRSSSAHRQKNITVTVPAIPPKRLAVIAENLTVRDKHQLIGRIHGYWILKRQSRNGIPLLRRLVTVFPHRITGKITDEDDLESYAAGLTRIKRLRQSMEKVRLLLELLRKRERLKRELVAVHEQVTNLQLQPFNILLRRTLQQLQSKDPDGIFAYPVPTDEVPDYLDAIAEPMDFSTMSSKIDDHLYTTMDDFESDFDLVINNCLTYNRPDSGLHKLALKISEKGKLIIAAARRMSERAQYNEGCGLHISTDVAESVSSISPTAEHTEMSSLDRQLKSLLKHLDVSQVVKRSISSKRLRRQISVVKRKMTMLHQQDSSSTDKKDTVTHNDSDKPIKTRSQCRHSAERVQTTTGKSSDDVIVNNTSPRVTTASQGHVNDVKMCFSHPITRGRNRLASCDAIIDSRQTKSCTKLDTVRPLRRLSERGYAEFTKHDEQRKQSPAKNNGVLLDINASSLNRAKRRLSLQQSELSNNRLNVNGFSVARRNCSKSIDSIHQLINSNEVDSSYESSYSGTSDSECNSPESKVSSNDVPHSPATGKRNTPIHRQSSAQDTSIVLHSKDVVWAKAVGFPWYPAMVVHLPKNCIAADIEEQLPTSVMSHRPKSTESVYLVRFFDKRYNWQWLPRNKLQPLGVDVECDRLMIAAVKKPKVRRAVRVAYDEALRSAKRQLKEREMLESFCNGSINGVVLSENNRAKLNHGVMSV